MPEDPPPEGMAAHLEAYNRVVRVNNTLAERLARVQHELHEAQHHAGVGIGRCTHASCMATTLLLENI